MATGSKAIATFGNMATISGVTINGTYESNRCVKYSDIVPDPVGKLNLSWSTATTTYAVYMNPIYSTTKVSPYKSANFSSLPRLNCNPTLIGSGLTKVTLTLTKGKWPYGSSGVYIYFVCKPSSQMGYNVYETYLNMSNIYTLNGGGDLSKSTDMSTVSENNWF